ncbi:MAG: MOSC domain-containing protein [Dehalococcoidia bacterium]
MRGEIVQLSTSPGGVPKLPTDVAAVDELGFHGDGHTDKKHHGGPDRAVCLWAIERIEALQAEGHPIFPGAAGENVTIRGIDWDAVVPGVRLRLGHEVVAEITGYTTPCQKNMAWFAEGNFMRMSQKLHPGWSRTYARVLQTGTLRPGDAVELLEVTESTAAG